MAGLLNADEVAWMTPIVSSSLDVSLPFSRKSVTPDGYGNTTETWTSYGNISMNIIKPTATLLQLYAEVIGEQRALVIRVMQTTDVRQGDRLVYDGLNWLVQNLMDAESYTVTKEYLITTVV
jgi:SPP1 family predicted phage head-tail adaptor